MIMLCIHMQVTYMKVIFPFQMKFSETNRIPTNKTRLLFLKGCLPQTWGRLRLLSKGLVARLLRGTPRTVHLANNNLQKTRPP